MGYDVDDHEPREGCACDLCVAYQDERHALADAASDAAMDAMESLVCLKCPAVVGAEGGLCRDCQHAARLDTPSGTVAARRRHRPLAEEVRVASEGWWRLVSLAAEHRDLQALRRLCGGQDPETAEGVDVWVALLAQGVGQAPARSEAVTSCGRPAGRM